ncbi:transcription initiation factor TFIID subunit D5 [Xylona heveae TC161]|uniref:TBP-associated factor 6 n=1 Tax=Xylona heveae (strain CBS 132557 / TC161) TaxID=1328760 RepID=A0A165ADQ4_XYLHT|nr:transcription initiation factor TFIID subunit D5 [Xylona heveae TC161]KZF20308.1 transcription initiation factor TFIID subunit D5 [Xylona heveae TC161]
MSVWNPENIKDVAESVGISALNNDVVENLSRDVEYRLSQVLEEALKFMRHSKRTTLSTQDIAQALRVLDVEPLYGYESTRPLRFGEASIGPGQPLFYVEDEEVDFEKLINAPLPKVPREISFTAHWLAVEGVQPSIPQNPTSADSRNQELVPKGPGANASLGAAGGEDNFAVKPLVKHILSKELQLYFERVCGAVLDENNDEYRVAALASLRSDPGLHQLVPYFVQFVAEKVTHSLNSLFILTQMMQLTSAMLDNSSLYVDPYVASIIPPILTCLIGRRLGGGGGGAGGGGVDSNNASGPSPLAHFALRDIAASLIAKISTKYAKASHTLNPRLARTCLKHFLDPHRSFGVHYGAIHGLTAIGGADIVRVLILPNLKPYDGILQDRIAEDQGSQQQPPGTSSKKIEAEKVVDAILSALERLEVDSLGRPVSGPTDTSDLSEEIKQRLVEKVGDIVGMRVWETRRPGLVRAVLEDRLAA